jgi:hypothetical protein
MTSSPAAEAAGDVAASDFEADARELKFNPIARHHGAIVMVSGELA